MTSVGADSVHLPVPAIVRTMRGLPPTCSTVPPGPDPLPRSTTPDAAMESDPCSWNVPAASSTAPRMPPDGASFETASMAAWMAAVSSLPPDGLTVCCTATFGMATPPPP